MKHLVLAFFLTVVASTALAADRTILVIESYHASYGWDESYLAGISETLGEGYRIINVEMDTKRQPKSLYQRQADLAWQKYLETEPDLVILGDDNAMKYLAPRLAKTETPVVYLGINNDPGSYVPAGGNITGILERPLFDFSIRTISQLLDPTPKKVLVLFDHGTTSNASVRETFQGKTRQVIHGVKVEMRMVGSWDLWKLSVESARDRGYDAIVVGLYHTLVDDTGHNIDAEKVMKWTSENTPVPPFGFWDFSVGEKKTIGGFVLSGREQGRAAAKVAKRILAGTSPAEIPPVAGEKGTFVFSRAQLEKYGIELPPEVRRKARLVD